LTFKAGHLYEAEGPTVWKCQVKSMPELGAHTWLYHVLPTGSSVWHILASFCCHQQM